MMKMFNEYINEIRKDRFTRIFKLDDKILCKQITGRKRLITIPLQNSPDLSFLAGIIIGDGYLGSEKRRIQIEMSDKNILEEILKAFYSIFGIKTRLRKVKKQKENYLQTWRIVFESKEISLLFNKIFEIPLGKKSDKVKVPSVIFTSNSECKKSFIRGLFFADGSFKKKTIRFSSSSQKLLEGLQKLFQEMGFQSVKRYYKNKRYNKYYFELFLMTNEAERFKLLLPEIQLKLRESPSQAMAQDAECAKLKDLIH